MENTPHYIFDWIEKIPFDTLNPAQRDEVLQYLTQEEYIQMQLAAKETGAFFGQEIPTNTDAIFAALSHRFDEVYTAPAEPKRTLVPVMFWKIAASLLLFAVGYLSFLVYKKQPQAAAIQTVLRDTVYVNVEQPAQEIKIHDTVFIQVPTKKQVNKPARQATISNGAANAQNWDGITPELNTLSITDINKGPNAPRNRSIQNDTFVKRFNYVSL
jgi:hypothetical protein